MTAITRLGSIAESASYASGEGSVEDIDIRGDYVDVLGARASAASHGAYRLGSGQWCGRRGSEHALHAHAGASSRGERHCGREHFPGITRIPTVAENLVDLQNHIAEHDCELGIAFDGDGDRIGVVDGKGRILWADQLMMLFAEDVLREDPGATIIADVKSSQVLFDEIARLGGVPVMWKTGHSLIKVQDVGNGIAAGRRDERPHLSLQTGILGSMMGFMPRCGCWHCWNARRSRSRNCVTAFRS